MKVVTVRNGFIIVTLLALSGAFSGVSNQGWFGTDAASAASPQEKTQARNDLNVVMASLSSVDWLVKSNGPARLGDGEIPCERFLVFCCLSVLGRVQRLIRACFM